MKKIFIYTITSALLYTASTWAMDITDEVEALQHPQQTAHKATQTEQQEYPITAEILGRTDLPFALALEAFDTDNPILLPGGQALRLDRSDVSRGRHHIPSGVLFHPSGAHWYEYRGKTWFHIAYTSSQNPHWVRKSSSPIPTDQQYWGRTPLLPGTDRIAPQIDFEFELISAAPTGSKPLPLRSTVIGPWFYPESEQVIPIAKHPTLLNTSPYQTDSGYVEVVKTRQRLDPVKDWGIFVTTPDHPILKETTELSSEGWTYTSFKMPYGYFSDLFRLTGQEDPAERRTKEGLLTLAKNKHWSVLTVSGRFEPPIGRYETLMREVLSNPDTKYTIRRWSTKKTEEIAIKSAIRRALNTLIKSGYSYAPWELGDVDDLPDQLMHQFLDRLTNTYPKDVELIRQHGVPYIKYHLLLNFFPSAEYTTQAAEYRQRGTIFRQEEPPSSNSFPTELDALFSSELLQPALFSNEAQEEAQKRQEEAAQAEGAMNEWGALYNDSGSEGS